MNRWGQSRRDLHESFACSWRTTAPQPGATSRGTGPRPIGGDHGGDNGAPYPQH